jgi:hypothetical protein
MMNVNILNNTIKGIVQQIPLVNSFFTTTPYESWNVKEVQYGSVSFVITKVSTRESTTTYDAVIYYADRLLEDNANKDSIHSDSAVVIQTIVGALNQCGDYLEVSYPVGITLFEQDFADSLAGGYASLTIATEGMGECFDEFDIPQIVGTSAYYTKEEINELFPLRNDLSTVAYTGLFADLRGVPDLVTTQQYNITNEGFNTEISALKQQIQGGVKESYFNEWKTGIENELDDKIARVDYETTTSRIDNKIGLLDKAVESRVDKEQFNRFAEGVQTELADRVTTQQYNGLVAKDASITKELENRVTKQEFAQLDKAIDDALDSIADKADKSALDSFIEGQNTINVNLAVELKNKVSVPYYETEMAVINSELDGKVSRTEFDHYAGNMGKTIESLQTAIDAKVSTSTFTGKMTEIDNALADRVTTQQYNAVNNRIDGLKTAIDAKVGADQLEDFGEGVNVVITNLAVEVANKLDADYFEGFRENIENEVDSKVSRQSFDQFAENVYTKKQTDTIVTNKIDRSFNAYIGSEEFKELVADSIDENLEMVVEDVTEEVRGKLDELVGEEVNEQIGQFVTIDELEDAVSSQYNDYIGSEEFRDSIDQLVADRIETQTGGFVTKTELASKNYVSKYYVDGAIVSVTNETDDKIQSLREEIPSIELDNYYTKEEVDAKIANSGGGTADVDLTDYYTKNEVNAELEKYYTKTEVDAIIGDIGSVLNAILYEK